jgi:ribonuclease T1
MRSVLHGCASFAVVLSAAAFLVSPVLFARDDVAPALTTQAPPEIAVVDLPREARETLRLIKQGGPFPYARDGAVFNNRERLLPARSRGYYREYTVQTPGARDRGARRIIAGGPGEYYYTEDHYASFRRIRESN